VLFNISATPCQVSLHSGAAQTPQARIVPDAVYPNMWRMAWPDGRLSDLANLARIKDAAVAICAVGPPVRDSRRFRWKIKRPAATGKPVREFSRVPSTTVTQHSGGAEGRANLLAATTRAACGDHPTAHSEDYVNE
jgi:hypothetical protein